MFFVSHHNFARDMNYTNYRFMILRNIISSTATAYLRGDSSLACVRYEYLSHLYVILLLMALTVLTDATRMPETRVCPLLSTYPLPDTFPSCASAQPNTLLHGF